MNNKEYIESVLKTESNDYEKIKHRVATRRTVRLLHAAIGKVTEAAEFIDQLKKWIFYGKDLDIVNLLEEIGDGHWYDGLAVDELRSSFPEVWEMNINKLKKRYGISFNEGGAINRNLEVERYVLEEKWKEVCVVCNEPIIDGHGKFNEVTRKALHEECFASYVLGD